MKSNMNYVYIDNMVTCDTISIISFRLFLRKQSVKYVYKLNNGEGEM